MPQEKEVPAGNDIETGLVVSPRNLFFPREQKKQYVSYHQYSGTGKRGSPAGILRGRPELLRKMILPVSGVRKAKFIRKCESCLGVLLRVSPSMTSQPARW